MFKANKILTKLLFWAYEWTSVSTFQMFGCGALAQLVLSGGSHGMFLTVNFAFGFAATLGILVCGQVSGKKTDSSVKGSDDKFPLTWFDILRSEFFKQMTEKSGG